MALKSVRELPRQLARRLAALGRFANDRTARRPGQQHPGAPVLSVILPVYNVQGQLAECIQSVLDQTLQAIELIIIDDDSTDHSPSIVSAYAERDERIKIITQAHAGLGQARNTGTRVAKAPFITFLDPDDTIPPGAYAYLVDTLERTGSDFAVGAVRGLKNGKSSRPAWVRNVHRAERLQLKIEDFPDAMQDVIACNRVFRRSFWDERVGPFPVGTAYEEHAPMVTAYVRAKSFDLLSATTSHVRIHEDAASIWQQKHQTGNLRDRMAVKDLAWKVVSSEASREVAAAWLGRVLDSELSVFVDFATHADDDYRSVLQAAALRFLGRADLAALRHVRVERKLRLALAAAGEWQQADQLIEYFRLNGSIPATRVVDGRILAVLPLADEHVFPRDLVELSEGQTSLSAGIRSARWRSDGRLEVEGWAFIQAIDLSTTASVIRARLLDPASGDQVELTVEPVNSPAITRWANHANHRYDTGGFRLLVDVDALVRAHLTLATRWQLVVAVAADGVTRQGSVHSLVRSGVGMRMRARQLSDIANPCRVTPVMDDRLGFVVHVRLDRIRAVALHTEGPNQLSGSLRLLRDLPSPPRDVVARQSGRTLVTSRLLDGGDGSFSFELSLPIKGRPEHWDFRVADEEGRYHRVSWPTEHDHGTEIGPTGPGTARWRRSPRGFVQLSSQPVLFRAHAVTVDESGIVVVVSLQGKSTRLLAEARLHSALAEVGAVAVEPLASGNHRLVFPVTAALWGSAAEPPLPSGTYTVDLTLKRGTVLTCGVAADFMEQMPIEMLTTWHGATLARRPGSDQLTITLGAPLRDDERGLVAQRRLARWYAESAFQPKEQVLFQCYRGEFATDSQREIHRELVRRQTPLDLVWGVHDLSVELPAGGRPVLMGSREWYETIGSARYLCNNNEFDRFFRRRDYQRFLQTFHGYPFKSMGLSFWRAREFSTALIDYECTRRTDAWTSILVPASFCEEIYRQEYLYDGEVLVTGYPRNDVLVDPDSRLRTAVLERLGVSPDKTVVLYAPTWRDAIATGDWSAKFFDALELDVLADELGHGYVLLLRGHNFNMREGVLKPSHATIVDVTRYPEITELILAADVAVLDYSSLRFDWVLTGKPVLFFVPDLADYLSARTALFEYGPTAPGPLLSTTAEVIDALQNLESVSMDYAQARDDFNVRFNELHDGHATERVVDAFFGAAARPDRNRY